VEKNDSATGALVCVDMLETPGPPPVRAEVPAQQVRAPESFVSEGGGGRGGQRGG
jgi:hypothetical protein